jgi:PAS domain S-box-containing protein
MFNIIGVPPGELCTGKLSLLMVDDDRGTLYLGKRCIELIDSDMEVVTSEDAAESLRLLEERRFDCVVVDYDMPDISGLELLEQIRKRDAEIPVIFFTGHGSEPVAVEAFREGANDYIIKDSDPSLYARLANAVRRHVEQARGRIRQRIAEAGIERARSLVERTFEVLDDALLILSENEMVILECNSAASRIFGYSREEMIGRTPDFLYRDASERVEFRRRLFTEVEKHGALWGFRFQFRRKDGTVFPTEHYVNPLRNEEGDVVGWVGLIRDMTEQVQILDEKTALAERFSRLFYLSPSPMLIVDMDGPILDVNDCFLKMTGHTRSEVIGQTGVSMGIFSQETHDRFAQELLSKGVLQDVEFSVNSRSGEPKHILASMAIVESGGRRHRLVILKDISELKKREQELLDFAWTVSHDLRAPLILIQQYLSLILEEGFVLPEGMSACDILKGQCAYALGFIDMLLAVAKAGRGTGDLSPVALDRTAKALLDLVKPADVKADLVIPNPFPEVPVDAFRFRELLQNLLSNAVTFRDPAKNGLIMTFTCEHRGDHYLFTLADNGLGISPDSLEKVFKLGYSTRKEKYACSGFGLTIARKILDVHGGRIWAESDGPGQGSRFCFTLPMPGP